MMDDLISRTAALDAIDHERELLIEREQYGVEHVVVHHARRMIEELPAVDAAPVVQRWISVKDRLPVNLETVIVACKGGVSFAWFNGAYWTKGAATKRRPIKTVTHWMPMPEPPKDGVA